MTDFRALTDEILQLLDYYIPEDDRPTCWDPWRKRARAALSEPESEGPTDEELLCIAAKSIEPYDQILPGEYEPESNSAVEVYGSELIIYARAVLACWGDHPTPQPVSVSERLPRPEDCDEEGRCWWYGDGEDMVGWTFQDLEGLSYYKATHWLPAHALPVPSHD